MIAARRRRAFTLVEMLVVIAIIGILVAITMPALSGARESARMTACKSNLRQFYLGMSSVADRTGLWCSGAQDWQRDGCPTEVGWAADLVNSGVLTGQMLCPSNNQSIDQTYGDLLNQTDAGGFSCLSKKSGSAPTKNPDGTDKVNACRKLLGDYSGGGAMEVGEDRRKFVEEAIYLTGYNTSYVASWFLVRSQPLTDENGNLRSSSTSCTTPVSLLERHSTLGPLKRARADSSEIASSIIPFLADANTGNDFLSEQVGPHAPGQPMFLSMSGGPVDKSTLAAPSFGSDATYTGADGWWKGWMNTLQDYRQFGVPHAGSCNILFADGSVRHFMDANRDGMLNNGFPIGDNGFSDDTVEIGPHEIFSRWRLKNEGG